MTDQIVFNGRIHPFLRMVLSQFNLASCGELVGLAVLAFCAACMDFDKPAPRARQYKSFSFVLN